MFPADPIFVDRVDSYFEPQVSALTAPYGRAAIFSIEEAKVVRVKKGETIVYRGWMVNAEEYDRMRMLVEQSGGKLLTNLDRYLNTHHIPNWYPALREFTAETFVIDNARLNGGCNLVAELKKLGWEKFFLKDFVKSLKTAGGSLINSPEEAPRVVELMEKYRGALEGGLCIRKCENLFDEKRYFIVNKKVWSPAIRETDRELLNTIAGRINSPFFSVDVAHNESGQPRVVEIGDGQVSDLVGWDPEFFRKIFGDIESLT